MAKIIDWDRHIGRRLSLRDLHVFFAVTQYGSLAKAAAELRVSQPAVSQLIADLEHGLGARLFDRTSRGVVLTIYGRALLARGRAAFDELKQGVRDIEFLSDPAAGEVKVGCPEAIAAILPPTVERFCHFIRASSSTWSMRASLPSRRSCASATSISLCSSCAGTRSPTTAPSTTSTWKFCSVINSSLPPDWRAGGRAVARSISPSSSTSHGSWRGRTAGATRSSRRRSARGD